MAKRPAPLPPITQKDDRLLANVSNYYTQKLQEHGPTPKGVDWNGTDSQRLRFEQLVKIIDTERFSITDLGCGYGSFYEFLTARCSDFSYFGYDISVAMINAARTRVSSTAAAKFVVGSRPSQETDYSAASGIFNVRLDQDKAVWRQYVNDTLDSLSHTSRLGFSFNCLTSYSDPEKARPDLFYADPCDMFDYCKRRYSRHVALLHDYGLYEFTILVRKKP